jgi:DNA-binding response OmpR family regulator
MLNILVVAEERSIRQAIKFELEDEGFIVIDVNNYQDALSAFNAFKCALVISDISNEKENGIRLLNRFKDEPFIAITTFPDSFLGKKARSVLKDRLIEKPFPIKLLISKVHETISSNYKYANAV